MKIKLKGKKLILLIALLILIMAGTIIGFGSKEISFISAITKSNQNLQYYDENTVFVLFTKYLDENQSVIVPTSVQTQTVDKLDYVIDIPQIDGYTPLVDKMEGTLNKEGVEYLKSLDYVKVVVKDNIYNIYITITYEAAPSAYTIVYYEQNTDLKGYTEFQRENVGGTTKKYNGEVYTGDEITLNPEERTGFHINTEKTKLTGKVEAFGTKVFEVYYDRNPYYLYTFNTGDSYYEPKILRYGQEISLTEEPIYSGYVFNGWKYSTSMTGEKIEEPKAMPSYNLYAEAQWIKSDTHYTFSYYTQNPDDDGYTNIGTIEIAAVSGNNLKDEDQSNLKTIIENGFSSVRGDTTKYYYYNEEKTKKENNNFDVVIEGKGITVIPIYFDRHIYNITLDFNDDSYSSGAEVSMGVNTYTDSYTFQARYEQNLLEHWITADDFTSFPTGTSFIGNAKTYYFKGWKANGNSTTYVSLRLNLTSTMIDDADSDRNIVYYAQYTTSKTSIDLVYLIESFDQESTTTSDTRVLYEGKYYEEAKEYSQKVYTSSSMNAKEIAGVTNVGQEKSGSKYQFFYDRNKLKITLYNMNNVYIEKELLYGQSMEEFVDTQLDPEDFSLETPGTKEWIFEGWYQDSNYVLPMVWTDENGTYKTITDNLVLYAKWSAPTYTVTFNTNGGTWTDTDSKYVKVDDNTYTLTVTEGESLVRPSEPTKLGNIASAWNYNVNAERVEYLFSDSQKVYSDLSLDLEYTANTNIPYKVRYISAQYKDGVLIEDISQYKNIVDLAPAKEVYNNAFGTTVEELPLDIYDKDDEDSYFVVNAREEKLTLTSESIDDNVIYFLYAKNPIVPYTVYYVKYQEDESGNPITYDYGDVPTDDALLGKKDKTVAAGYATEIADDIDGWTVNGSYSQTIKLTLKASQNTMYFYYNENETGKYLINFFFMNENGEYSKNPDYTYTSEDSAGKILYGIDFDKFIYENGPTSTDYDGRQLDTEKCGDTYLIVTTTSETSAMDIYFKNRDDLSYTVKYQDEDGNMLSEDKVVRNQSYSSTITETAISIDGYKLVDANSQKSIKIGLNTNEIVFTYTKRTDLKYTVNYYIEGTTTALAESKTVANQTYNSVVTEKAIEIEGCTKVNPTTQTITIGVGDNVVNFYYRLRTDLSYTVKYLEKDTNNELAKSKIVGGQTYKSEVTEQAIEISGYDKVTPTGKTIEIAVEGNEIVFYYTKRTDLSYTVKYLEKDTNNELAKSKVVGGQTYKSEATETAIEISGYDKVNQAEKSTTIEVEGNEIVFYYTKRTDLSYTVKYLENDTNNELAKSKIVGGQTYKSEVTEQAIEISGYDKVNQAEKSTTIEVTGNEIVFYYTKRTDLSYTVKYLENDTNNELAKSKIVGGQTYKSEVTEQAIEISGYDKVNQAEKSTTIEVTGNEIVFYYTKRTDLSYTVKYLENDTNNELAKSKVVEGQTYKSEVTEQAIEISGYDKVNQAEKTIEIAVSGNEIVFYYTKRTDLSYTVKYLEKDTNNELAKSKIVGGQTYKSEVTEQAIEISGYDKVTPPEKSTTIEVEGNEIVFYYTKRTDLNYTVKYLEKDTSKELSKSKVVDGNTYKSEITETAIEISGYVKINPEETITIEVTGNEIIFYYKKLEGLSYTVNYFEKGTETKVAQSKTVDGKIFEDEVTESAIDIEGYDKETTTEKSIVINVGENIINFYYTKRTDLSYTVKYLEKDTNTVLSAEKVVEGQTYKSEVTEQAIEISGYDKVNQAEKTIEIAVSGNEIVFYYTKRTDLSYTVKYLEKDTNTVLSTEKVVERQTYKSEVTEQAIDILGYDKTNPKEETITIEVEGNEIVFYYTKKTDIEYSVEFYYGGVLDSSKTETHQATFKQVIDSYTNNDKLGYKLDEEKNFPLQISANSDENVIQIYYVIDENQTKEIKYTVEYYKEGTLIDIDTQTNKKTVQVLDSEVLKVNKADINIVNKYFGYKFDSTEPTEIPDEVNNGDVIKVYYVIDEENTKTLSYTVKYYKEGTLVEKDTQTVSETVQILQPDTLDVRKGEINTVNKYAGYKLKETIPNEIPNKIATGETINVYYVIDENQRKDLSYTIEYYKDGKLQKDETKEVSIDVQLLQPNTIPVDKSEMVLSGKYVGYKLEKTSPSEIPTVVNNGDVIKIYYVKDQFSYKVEYYYNGNKDEAKTDYFTATYEDVIKEYTDKNIFGYRLEKTEGLPLKISEKSEENVIKVYYIIDDGSTKTLNYKVEYYKDGILQEGDTQLEYKTVQVLQPNTFEIDKSKINLVDKYTGYKLEKTEPDGIPDVATTGDVYKVYYVKDTFGYTIEYYYEGQLISEKTEKLSALYEKIIDVYPDKTNGKYYLDDTENFPMKITEISSNNIIKVYYEKKLSTITVHYYWDGINNINNVETNDKKRTLGEKGEDNKTKENEKVSVSQDVIIEDKVDTIHTITAASDVAEKYELVSKPVSEQVTMTVEKQEFEYIYRLKDAKVTVNFIESSSGKILGTKVIEGQVDDRYHAVPESILGYSLISDKIPENEVGKMTLEPITVNFYYDLAPQENGGTTQTTIPAEKTDFKGNGPATGDTEIIAYRAIVTVILIINISQGKILKIDKKVGKRYSSKEPSKVAKMSRLEKDCKKEATRRQRKH